MKGNAYGLGIAPVAQALWEAGCRTYFVARPKEGEELRAILPEATIYVLDGLFAGQAEFYAKLNLCPALISIAEAREWAASDASMAGSFPAPSMSTPASTGWVSRCRNSTPCWPTASPWRG